MKVVHVIIGLHTGGAEAMLLKLLQATDRDRFVPEVVALMDGGPVADDIRDLGVPVHHLGLRSPLHAPAVLWRLRDLAAELAPDVVQGWMYHGNVAATLLAKWAPGRPDLLWNIRHSLADPGREKALTRALIRLGARWSGRPRAVVHNATISIDQHAAVGFGRGNAVMLPNGFDLARFRPDEAARAALRARLGVAEGAVLVGGLARRHPMKGQEILLEAVATARAQDHRLHAVLAGRGVTADDPALAARAAHPDLAGCVHLLGPESRPAALLAGLDLFVLSSTHGEGFPNVLGEAMACGVPCVATDVGEAAVIVGATGPVVAPGDVTALARAIATAAADLPAARAERAVACRAAIATRYGLDRIAARYEDLWSGGRGADAEATP